MTNDGPDSGSDHYRLEVGPLPWTSLEIESFAGTIPSSSIKQDPASHTLDFDVNRAQSGNVLTMAVTVTPSHATIETSRITASARVASDDSAAARTAIRGISVSGGSFADQLLGASNRSAAPAPSVIAGLPAPATTLDTKPPVVRLVLLPTTITRRTLARKGLTYSESADETTAFDNTLLGSARKLTLGRRATTARTFNVTLARSALPLGTGSRAVRLNASRRPAGNAKRFSLELQVVATDARGNHSLVTGTIRVRWAVSRGASPRQRERAGAAGRRRARTP